MNKEEISVDPNLLVDKNYLAFRDSFEELMQEYKGKHVAFIDGKLTMVRDNVDELLEALAEPDFIGKDAFVAEVTREEKVIRMGGPNIVYRKD